MKHGKHARGRKSSPKHSLNLPDLDQAESAVLNSLPSKESRRGYRHAIDEFVAWYCSEPRLSFNKAVVARYRIHLESRQLAPGTINARLAAVRRLAYEAADSGLLSPDLAACIRRVKGPKNLGVRLGNWLTADQAKALWQVPDPSTLIGKRDRALLGFLLGCACGGKRPLNWRSPTFNDGRTIGPSWICLARADISARCRFRTGSRARSIRGLYLLA
jgi:integrase